MSPKVYSFILPLDISSVSTTLYSFRGLLCVFIFSQCERPRTVKICIPVFEFTFNSICSIMPLSPVCHCCGVSSEEHKMLICCVCKKKFIHTCVDFTASEVRTAKSKRGFTWTCDNCIPLGNDLNDLKAAIVALKNEVSELKKVNMSTARDVLSDEVFEEILLETRERERRRCNLIIFGITEDNSKSKSDRVEADKAVCVSVLEHLSVEYRGVPSRLGRFDPSKSSPRPVKVTLDNEKLVHDTIHRATVLRDNPDFSNIRISLDRTPRQIQHYNSLKSEMAGRVAAGEQLKIKYTKGIPRIVPLN